MVSGHKARDHYEVAARVRGDGAHDAARRESARHGARGPGKTDFLRCSDVSNPRGLCSHELVFTHVFTQGLNTCVNTCVHGSHRCVPHLGIYCLREFRVACEF